MVLILATLFILTLTLLAVVTLFTLTCFFNAISDRDYVHFSSFASLMPLVIATLTQSVFNVINCSKFVTDLFTVAYRP